MPGSADSMPPLMGQSVTVVEKKSSNPKVLRFEINRSLTGMGHERYRSLDDVVDDRVVDVLARRLFEHGGIDSVHVNSSVITVQLGGGNTGTGLLDVIENLFRFYGTEVPADAAAADGSPTEGVDDTDAAAAPETTSDDVTAQGVTLAEAEDAPKETETSSAME